MSDIKERANKWYPNLSEVYGFDKLKSQRKTAISFATQERERLLDELIVKLNKLYVSNTYPFGDPAKALGIEAAINELEAYKSNKE